MICAYEVIKHFRFSVDGIDEYVRGEVRKVVGENVEHPFQWWISHNYKPTADAATVYYPSRLTAATSQEAEAYLFAYASSFTAAFGVTSED